MNIQGLEGMSIDDLERDLQHGGRFVMYQYCVSVLIMTFTRPTDIYYIRAGESAVTRGLQWSLLSMAFGWWGFPWGLIYTPITLVKNFGGGTDVTADVLAAMRQSRPKPAQEQQPFQWSPGKF